jgi:hypothetical protein
MLWSGSALAEDPGTEDLRKLSGTRARFSDRQLIDEVHWREVYHCDGTFRSYAMGRVRTGKWFIHSDDLCLDLLEPDGGALRGGVLGLRDCHDTEGNGLNDCGRSRAHFRPPIARRCAWVAESRVMRS